MKIELSGAGGVLSAPDHVLSYSADGGYYWVDGAYAYLQWVLNATTFVSKAGAPAMQSETDFKVSFFLGDSFDMPLATYDKVSVIDIHPAALSPTLTPTLAFAPQTTFGTGPAPQFIAVGDFNNDGKQDLATPNQGNGTVSILLGNGDGTFQQAVSYGTGNIPVGISVGDFNHDGALDIAVANTQDDTVSVLLGNGDGTFQPQVTYATESHPFSVAVADVDSDGRPDLIVTDLLANRVSVLLGNGDGTFQSQASYPAGNWPNIAVSADVNQDGKPDIIVTDNQVNSVSVLLGKGDGTFQQSDAYPVSASPTGVAAGDFNHDGKLDIVVTSFVGNTVSVLLGNGDGTFQPQATYVTGRTPNIFSLADMNGDGNLDIVVQDADDREVSVLLGNGDGTFQPQRTFAVGDRPGAIAVTDLNGDGQPDIVASNIRDNTVSVLLNTTIGQTTNSSTPINPFANLVLTDVNANATDTLTIALSGATGTLRGDASLKKVDATHYTLTGDAATVQSELQALSFTFDAGQPGGVTTFSVTDRSVVGDQYADTTQATVVTVRDSDLPTGQITGFVYEDVTANNMLGSGDHGLAGLVKLFDQTGQTLKLSAQTDSSGHYSFGALADGTYKVSFHVAKGYLPDLGTLNGNGDLVVGDVVVKDGAATQLNEGYFAPAHIGGHISTGGVGLDGVEIDLLDANGHKAATTHSANGGLYSFDNLTPGVYVESAVAPTGYIAPPSHSITLVSGQEVTNGDFALKAQDRQSDFNGDHLSDILFQNTAANGAVYIWSMDDTTILGDHSGLPGVAGADWAVKGVGDFNGDGKSDIVFQNTASDGGGAVYIWAMDGASIAGDGTGSVASAGADWAVKGVGDFNGDGKSDIVFQNANANGAVYIWSMDGTTISGNDSGMPGVAGADWAVKGVGDFNGDGKSDIVFQNTASDGGGAVYIWAMNGASIAGDGTGYVASAGADWVVKGVGDFNGDGRSDIVFQNANENGAVYIWSMEGTTISANGSGMPGVAGADWAVKGVGDYNGDGKSDILFQNTTSGAVYIWDMDGAHIINPGAGWVATAGADWHATA